MGGGVGVGGDSRPAAQRESGSSVPLARRQPLPPNKLLCRGLTQKGPLSVGEKREGDDGEVEENGRRGRREIPTKGSCKGGRGRIMRGERNEEWEAGGNQMRGAHSGVRRGAGLKAHLKRVRSDRPAEATPLILKASV